MECKGDGNIKGGWNGLQRLWKKIGGIGNQKNNQDYLDHSIVEIG